jgi:hypothetical protein
MVTIATDPHFGARIGLSDRRAFLYHLMPLRKKR